MSEDGCMNLDYWLRRLSGKATCLLGGRARLYASARIRNISGDTARIRIGDNSHVAGELLVFRHGGDISIGAWCYIGYGARLWSAKSIIIGNRVLISHNVNVFDSLTHPLSAADRHLHFRAIVEKGHPKMVDLGEREIVIDDDVWIGAGAILLRGVRIGKGAVVGAGSVVTHDVAPFSIVAGNPARLIRELDADER